MTWTDQVGELCFAAIKNDRKGWESMNPTESAGCISFQMVLSQFFFFFFFFFTKFLLEMILDCAITCSSSFK
jgi:hypothetical protein